MAKSALYLTNDFLIFVHLQSVFHGIRLLRLKRKIGYREITYFQLRRKIIF